MSKVKFMVATLFAVLVVGGLYVAAMCGLTFLVVKVVRLAWG